MSIGNNQKPYRSACGTRSCFTGSMFQHGHDDVKTKYINVTTETDHCGHLANGQFTLFYQVNECGNYICTTDCNDCTEGVANFNLTTNTPTITQYPYSGRGTGLAWNDWEESGTVNFKDCRQFGFKAVQALKWWHGTFGFQDASSSLDCATGLVYSNTKYRKLEIVCSATSTWSWVSDYYDSGGALANTVSQSESGVAEVNQTTEVNRLTGQTDLSDTASTSSTAITVTELNTFVSPTPVVTNFQYPFEWVSGATELLGTSRIDPHVFYNTWAMPCSYSIFNGYITGSSASDLQTAINATSPTTLATLPAGNVTMTPTAVVSISNTVFEVTVTWDISPSVGSPAPDANVITTSGNMVFHFKATLSESYTNEQVQDDASEQASKWTLRSDSEYPWRDDANVFISPVVYRDEIQNPQNPYTFPDFQIDDYTNPIANGFGDIPFSAGWQASPAWGKRDWLDPNTHYWKFASGDQAFLYTDKQTTEAATGVGELFTGGIDYKQGKPLDAGYTAPWDYDHDVYHRADCSGDGDYAVGARTRGIATPIYLPQNAPKWTPDTWYADHRLWPCAFGFQTNECFLGQNFIETLIPRPSQNFARPYGADRFLLDETAVYCYDGGILYEQDGSTPVAFATHLPGEIWGGDSAGGFYDGFSTDRDGNVTLGTLVYSLPTGWTDGDTNAFGQLRFPDCPGFGGLLQCTATYDGVGTTTFTVADSPYIITGDAVDIYAFGLSSIGTNVALTRVSDTSFTCSGDYHTAVYLVPHKLFDSSTSGSKYYFANDTSKGDYVWREWTLKVDLATPSSTWVNVSAPTAEQSCLPPSPCGAAIVGAEMWTPQLTLGGSGDGFSGDDYTGGDVVLMPSEDWTGFNANVKQIPYVANGTVWLGQCEQQMVDLLYQNPHNPCGNDLGWTSDDGSCLEDTILVAYYRFPQVVEARITLPSNYGMAENETPPSLPAGANPINPTVSPPDYAAIGATSTGLLTECIVNPLTPWILYKNQLGCVCGSGRFMSDYELDGVYTKDCGTI